MTRLGTVQTSLDKNMNDVSLAGAEIEMSDLSIVTIPDDPIEFRGLRYPYGQWAPETGEVKEIVPGVLWFRQPLPMSLNHINLYALDDGDGWALVDTGLNLPASKQVWETLFAGPLAGRKITRVIVTHYHPDHLGLAGWLAEKFNVQIWISRADYFMARTLMLDSQPVVPDEILNFYRRAGWAQKSLETFKAGGWGFFKSIVSPLPRSYRRMKANDVLTIGKRQWRVVIGTGHAPEHVCLVCDDAKLMISGDQVLPKITSNVSVYPTEPDGDPLGDWMDSLDLMETLPADLFVLPSHNEPFYNLHVRAQALRADHLAKLDKLHIHCAEAPRTALETFAVLFKRPVQGNEMMMATGEALAHIHYLEARGKLQRETVDGIDRFSAV
jgi:glyoxylase-like metal-dependent hydrolase (beta-lactamase superfamily II)